jgi:formate dehydrogenase subunit gamma
MKDAWRSWCLALVAAAGLGLVGPMAMAQNAAGAAPPAGFVAPSEPKPEDTNAERAVSQPGNNAPLWRAVRDSGSQQGYSSLPGLEAGALIQPFAQYPGSSYTTAGEAWRQARNNLILPVGGILLLLVLAACAVFYKAKGPMGGHVQDTGRLVERFTGFERMIHWTNAIAFTLLGISGVVMSFGKSFLLPVIGPTLFGWLTYALKTMHNFVGPVFAVTVVIVFLTFVRDNLPGKGDLNWLAKAGGMLGSHEVPSHRFNAGEKVLFWLGVFGVGIVVAMSGLVLNKLVPGLEYTRGVMQMANLVHSAASIVMVALFLGHIYMGTLGVKGAFGAMRTGFVDEGWAREHHELWHDDIKAGKIPAVRTPAGKAALAQAATQTP